MVKTSFATSLPQHLLQIRRDTCSTVCGLATLALRRESRKRAGRESYESTHLCESRVTVLGVDLWFVFDSCVSGAPLGVVELGRTFLYSLNFDVPGVYYTPRKTHQVQSQPVGAAALKSTLTRADHLCFH